MPREWIMITGSSKGLGECLALVYSKNNYDVILHGRDEESLKKVRKKVLENNVNSCTVRGDLRLEETIEKLAQTAIEKNISTLINNAGIGHLNYFKDFDIEEIESVINVNLIVPIKLTKKIYPLFLKKQSGTIININGIDGLKITRERRTAYSSSKYGLKGFTDALRYESKKYNIRVIGVHLGGMRTGMYSNNVGAIEDCMDPEEVAQNIFDLSKDYSSLGVDEAVIGRKRY